MDVNTSNSSKLTFGPLSFDTVPQNDFTRTISPQKQECLLCSEHFDIKTALDTFLKHLFEVHHLIIEDFQGINRFDRYVAFWKRKFTEKNVETIIPAVKIDGTQQFYYVLSVLLSDDKKIRHELKLENALEQQETERTDVFTRNCLFCKLNFVGKVGDFVKHLSTQHNLQLGKPENLVFVAEFLDAIEDKINNLRCIYCEKTFTERNVLKEHMRKKLHKRINPANKCYDRFYVVNYLEIDKNWQHLQKEDDGLPITLEDNSDEDWSDWNEKDPEINCLFCEYNALMLLTLCDHMQVSHQFDFQAITKNLEYYQRVKLVNYIRRQSHAKCCVYCDQQFEDLEGLRNHLRDEKHCKIPDLKVFDQPEYYFPTYENDTLLYYLDEILDCELVN